MSSFPSFHCDVVVVVQTTTVKTTTANNNKDATVRQTAVVAVPRVAGRGCRAAIECLLQVMQDESVAVRLAAVESLAAVAQVGDTLAIEALRVRLEDQERAKESPSGKPVGPCVGMCAAKALKKLVTSREELVQIASKLKFTGSSPERPVRGRSRQLVQVYRFWAREWATSANDGAALSSHPVDEAFGYAAELSAACRELMRRELMRIAEVRARAIKSDGPLSRLAELRAHARQEMVLLEAEAQGAAAGYAEARAARDGAEGLAVQRSCELRARLADSEALAAVEWGLADELRNEAETLVAQVSFHSEPQTAGAEQRGSDGDRPDDILGAQLPGVSLWVPTPFLMAQVAEVCD
ncbi:unnamed protein product [Polarella glacialis]|uniref:Uncharacterized protein n=1 Tax=Polarella glacialis TaxID=89957 RepID=A0A813F1J2_POLGL|nr:unnamed protein product [Polarella glacialis]